MRKKITRFALPVFFLLTLIPARARAQNPPVNADLFRPSVHRGDILNVQTAGRDQGGIWYAGAMATLSNQLLSILDSRDQKIFGAINWHLKTDVFASVRLFRFLSLGVDVPIILYEGGDSPVTQTGLRRISGTMLGDIRLGIKATIVGRKGEGFGLALSEDVTFPSAYPTGQLTGDELPTGTTLLVLDYLKRGWQVALNAGYRVRKSQKILDHHVRNQIILSGGLSVPIICGRFHAIGTLEGRTSGIEPFEHGFENALDGLLGAQVNVGALAIQAVGGGGFLHGLGSSAYRGLISLAYEPKPYRGCIPDRDGDGVEDPRDRCPDLPGDPNLAGCPDQDGDGLADDEDVCPAAPGPRELKGCPDQDGDGVADVGDKCPTIPGKKDLAGCPDRDGDGVADGEDKCPDDFGSRSLQGCPDKDGDGVIDREDRCPSVPGPRATQGCPDKDSDDIADSDDKCPLETGKKELAGCPDSDNDGIADYEDRCPDVPGADKKQGCPEAQVVVTAKQIFIAEMVFFQTGKDRILPRSYGILQAVAKTILGDPSIRKVRIEGHTDNVGSAESNMDLSRRRAESVMKFLVKSGVPAGRLVAEGFGVTKPIADNATAAGRERNRRVAFMVVERAQ